MKPAPFKYFAATDVEHAIALLEHHGAAAKLLAGGQTLVPMMNFRLARPEVLVDLNRVPGLSGISVRNGDIVIGSMTRHAELESSELVREHCPLLAEAMPLIAHPAIRNRGTIGGSVAHADPAAEMPVALTALNATLRARSREGQRDIPVDEFFVAYLTTALRPNEVLTEIEIPSSAPGTASAFVEFSRRHGDFALVAAAVTLRIVRGTIAEDARIALGGVGAGPVRARRAEALLHGAAPASAAFEAAAAAAAEEIDPPGDIHATPEYRRQLARHYVGLALARAHERATAAAQGARGHA